MTYSPMASHRMVLCLLLVLCLGFTVYMASFYKAFSFHTILSAPTEIIATTTVTMCAQETAAPGGLKHEVVEELLQPHLFRADGLLEVNPNGRHPIYDLVERAEAEWDKKLKKQSKSLDEAVAEYRRRYRRAPPKGFDGWWSYCKQHNVQLPDEYDRIYNNLEPFWGMNPVDLQRIQAKLETESDSFTIGKTEESEVKLLAWALPAPGGDFPLEYHLGKAREIADILKNVSQFIPPFRAVFSPHDNPYMATDWELKTQALHAAAAQTYINISEPPPAAFLGWPSVCSPDSLLRRTTFDPDVSPTPPTTKTFIYDHRKAMDPCNHPSLLHHHAQFFSDGPVQLDQVMMPIFSFCSTSLHYNIVTAIKWDEEPDVDPKFQDRLDERLSWRGSTTGVDFNRDNWKSSHRVRLVGWAYERNGTAPVLQSMKSRNDRVGEGRQVTKARLNPAMLDVAFAGCEPDVCEILGDQFQTRHWQNAAAAANYKYTLDIDGNGWSSRNRKLMASGSLIFKSSVYPEWFEERVQPWVHFVPYQMDLSDLYDSLTFFRGDLNGESAHEEMAAQIALAGQDWTKTFWRDEDMTAYMFRLFLEYARVMSPNREAMSYYKNGDAAL